MDVPLRKPVQSRWLTAGLAVLCAAAGVGLRWRLAKEKHSPAVPQKTAEVRSIAPAALSLAPDSLPATSQLDRLTSLAARLPEMTLAEVAPLVKSLIAICPEESGYAWRYNSVSESPEQALLQALFTRWAELDAPGMIATSSGPEFRHSVNVRFWAVTAWAELRGTLALEAVAQQWPGLVTSAAWEMVQRQPGRCAELLPWLRGVDDFPISSDAMYALRKEMATEDYVRLAMAVGHEGQVWGSLQDLCQTDARRAMQIAKSLPPGKFRDSALDTLLREMDGDYYGLFAAAGLSFRTEYEALPPGSKVRQELVEDYAERILAEENQETALQWARSLTDDAARSEALERIAIRLPENTPAADRTRLRAESWLAYPSFEASLTTSDFKAWHTENPNAANEWLQTVSNSTLRAALLRGVVTTPEEDLARFSSSRERLAYVTDSLYPNEAKRKEQAENKEPPSLLSQDNVPEDLAHLAQLTAAAKSGVKDDVWAAANSEDRRFLSADAIKYRFEHSGLYKAQLDKAIELFDSMTPAERSLGAWYEAGRARVLKDTTAASEWVNSLPPGPERDAAAIALVENLSGVTWRREEFVSFRSIDDYRNLAGDRDVAAAFAWAASMSGEAERIQYVSQAAHAWALQDAAAARAAVTASGLPDSAKQSLLKQLPEGGAR